MFLCAVRLSCNNAIGITFNGFFTLHSFWLHQFNGFPKKRNGRVNLLLPLIYNKYIPQKSTFIYLPATKVTSLSIIQRSAKYKCTCTYFPMRWCNLMVTSRAFSITVSGIYEKCTGSPLKCWPPMLKNTFACVNTWNLKWFLGEWTSWIDVKEKKRDFNRFYVRRIKDHWVRMLQMRHMRDIP